MGSLGSFLNQLHILGVRTVWVLGPILVAGRPEPAWLQASGCVAGNLGRFPGPFQRGVLILPLGVDPASDPGLDSISIRLDQ